MSAEVHRACVRPQGSRAMHPRCGPACMLLLLLLLLMMMMMMMMERLYAGRLRKALSSTLQVGRRVLQMGSGVEAMSMRSTRINMDVHA